MGYPHAIPTDEDGLDAYLESSGASKDRVTGTSVDDAIETAAYHVFPGTTVTVCCITLRNGYQVIGHSACADPANFDPEVGETCAYENARRHIWALEAYLIRQRLWAEQQAQEARDRAGTVTVSPLADATIRVREREEQDSWTATPFGLHERASASEDFSGGAGAGR